MTDDQTLTPDHYAPQRVLVSVAHADDIEFGMVGTVATWIKNGAKVTYLIITDNRSGSNDPDADIDALIATRQREQSAAAKVAGVTDVRFLGYQDGVLQPTLELRKAITRVIREVQPQVVVTMDPETVIADGRDYINHPDHRAAAEATLYAVFPSAETRPIFADLIDEGLEPCKVNKVYMTLTNKPDTYVDISPTMETKRAALREHASQINEDVIDMLARWNADAGEKIGVSYAETFRVLNLNEDELEQNLDDTE
jgi:LmbE family N-acetylglucosaminyl deacetylase